MKITRVGPPSAEPPQRPTRGGPIVAIELTAGGGIPLTAEDLARELDRFGLSGPRRLVASVVAVAAPPPRRGRLTLLPTLTEALATLSSRLLARYIHSTLRTVHFGNDAFIYATGDALWALSNPDFARENFAPIFESDPTLKSIRVFRDGPETFLHRTVGRNLEMAAPYLSDAKKMIQLAGLMSNDGSVVVAEPALETYLEEVSGHLLVELNPGMTVKDPVLQNPELLKVFLTGFQGRLKDLSRITVRVIPDGVQLLRADHEKEKNAWSLNGRVSDLRSTSPAASSPQEAAKPAPVAAVAPTVPAAPVSKPAPRKLNLAEVEGALCALEAFWRSRAGLLDDVSQIMTMGRILGYMRQGLSINAADAAVAHRDITGFADYDMQQRYEPLRLVIEFWKQRSEEKAGSSSGGGVLPSLLLALGLSGAWQAYEQPELHLENLTAQEVPADSGEAHTARHHRSLARQARVAFRSPSVAHFVRRGVV